MQFFGLQSLRRNWYVGIFGLLVTAVLVIAAAILIPAKYVATSQLVLLGPISQPVKSHNGVANPNGVTNPFLGIDPYLSIDALDSMANVVSLAMTDSETAQALQNAGVSQYSVVYDPTNAGPILTVQAEGSSREEATGAVSAVTEQVPLTLARLQENAHVSPSAFLTVDVIARPSAPTKSSKTQLRAIGLALVAGLVLTVLAIAFIDGWRIRRRLQGPPAEHALQESDREREAADLNGPFAPGEFQREVPVSESARDDTVTLRPYL